MADSDGEYVDISDDELMEQGAATESNYGTRNKLRNARGKGDGKRAKSGAGRKAVWEDIQRSWEHVAEAADGTISVHHLLEAEKRRRLLRDTTPVQRGIIRHLMLVLDMSFAMAEKDLLPNRYLLALNSAVDFVRAFFDQNPISQLGIIGMRDGIAVPISNMSGNPAEHIEKLREWAEQQDPMGSPSLQNALEWCRGMLFQAPSHATREVLVVFGALMTSDPGDIIDTIANLIKDRIRVSVIGLSAQVAVCAEICSRTNDGDGSGYAVALHEQHFRELLKAATTPPITRTGEKNNTTLIQMGFPSREITSADKISLCACHNRPSREGYECPRCLIKVCRIPIDCPVCGLTLVLSSHLARSYHHLFPLKNWVTVPWANAAKSVACFCCQTVFPSADKGKSLAKGKEKQAAGAAVPPTKGVSESGRYECPDCHKHFCIDCDVYAHETLHNCFGCQGDTRIVTQDGVTGAAMEIDT